VVAPNGVKSGRVGQTTAADDTGGEWGWGPEVMPGYGRSNSVASTAMSEHEKHTEFLKRCIHYDESARRLKLAEEIARIQCDMRCVGRAAWLMAILTALAVAGLVYPAILVENFHDVPQFVMNLVFALGLASLFCFLVFKGVGMVYRVKLDQRREECRELVTKLLESNLGKPANTLRRDNRAGEEGASRGREMVDTAPGSSTDRIERGSRS
jgi:hypothetical protein